jgi:hypothetical protein
MALLRASDYISPLQSGLADSSIAANAETRTVKIVKTSR